MNITPHLNCITTLTCEIQMYKKPAIIGSKRIGKRVGKQKKLQIKTAVNDLYNAALC